MKRILDLFLPNRCVMTGRIIQDSNGLSAEGFAKIDFISDPACYRCGAPLQYEKDTCKLCIHEAYVFDHARSIFIYNETSKKLILQYKHGDKLSLSPTFAKWMISYGGDILKESDVLIPVPLHPSRLRKRMYNQAAELVKEVSKITKQAYALDGLLRVRATLPQGHEDRHKRILNLKDAFKANSLYVEKFKGKNILIVDDVMTTGATVNACAEALLSFSPKKISVLTLAKVLLT